MSLYKNESHPLNSISSVSLNEKNYDKYEFNLSNSNHQQFGFKLTGYCPCYIESVEPYSIADKLGLKRSDLIMKINNINCCRATLKTTLNLIKSNQASLMLTIYRLKLNSSKKRKQTTCMSSRKENAKKAKGSLLNKLASWWKCSSASNATIVYNSTSFYGQSNEDSKLPVKLNSIKSSTSTQLNCGDTGYDSLSRQYSSESPMNMISSNQHDSTIETVTNTINSYSDCDLTIEHSKKLTKQSNHNSTNIDENKIHLIGNLIKIEDKFVEYLNNAVSTLVRPLRGFFIKQHDYFTLFQNIEKILVISENFLISMNKWSAYDLYTRIGQLYIQKLNLFYEAFKIYCNGYLKSKLLYNELKVHSKQFRLFLKETETTTLNLNNLLDLPIIYLNEVLNIFKQIRMHTTESRKNPSEAPHIDSVIFQLRNILSNLDHNTGSNNDNDQLEINNEIEQYDINDEYLSEILSDEDDDCEDNEFIDYNDTATTASFMSTIMSTTVSKNFRISSSVSKSSLTSSSSSEIIDDFLISNSLFL